MAQKVKLTAGESTRNHYRIRTAENATSQNMKRQRKCKRGRGTLARTSFGKPEAWKKETASAPLIRPSRSRSALWKYKLKRSSFWAIFIIWNSICLNPSSQSIRGVVLIVATSRGDSVTLEWIGFLAIQVREIFLGAEIGDDDDDSIAFFFIPLKTNKIYVYTMTRADFFF